MTEIGCKKLRTGQGPPSFAFKGTDKERDRVDSAKQAI